MLQIPIVEQSTRRASVCPPAIWAKKRATRTSANFTTMFEWLYDEKMKESTRRLRLIRRARSSNCGAVEIFDEAIGAIKQRHYADGKLKEKKAKLPDNQKIDYAEARLDPLTSSSHPLDVDRYFSHWIKEAKKTGNFDRASYLLDQRNHKLKQLKLDHRTVLDDQKQSGLWKLRVEAAAAANIANRLTFEATETKLRTVADCVAAARFIGVLCREDINHSNDLNAYVIRRLSRRLVECLSSLEGRAR
jgi:hypothetical protein